MNGDDPYHINPLSMHELYTKGNMESIVEMIPIDISRTPSVVENLFDQEDCSPNEIQIYIELFKSFHNVFS
jgi:hypothetical protein